VCEPRLTASVFVRLYGGKRLVNEKTGCYNPLNMMTLDDLRVQIGKLKHDLEDRLAAVDDGESLDAFRVDFLGRKGRVSQLFKHLGQLDASQRSEAGQLLNELKKMASEAVSRKAMDARRAELAERLSTERVDMSLPGVYSSFGYLHSLTRVQREI